MFCETVFKLIEIQLYNIATVVYWKVEVCMQNEHETFPVSSHTLVAERAKNIHHCKRDALNDCEYTHLYIPNSLRLKTGIYYLCIVLKRN